MKRCYRCKAEKPRSEFYPHSRSKDGLQGWCKPCQREHKRLHPHKRKKKAPKRCPRCEQEKSVKHFSKNRRRKDGLNFYCRACCSRMQKWNRAHRRHACGVEGCVNKGSTTRGMCDMHYTRFRKTGDPGPPGKIAKRQTACRHPHCDRPHFGLGWCVVHYHRVKRTGTPERSRVRPKTCLVDGCDNKHRSLGLCSLHYNRWYRTGRVGPAAPRAPRKTCTQGSCTVKHRARGLCAAHLAAYYRENRKMEVAA